MGRGLQRPVAQDGADRLEGRAAAAACASPPNGAEGWRRVMADRRCRLASKPDPRCGKLSKMKKMAGRARSTLGTDDRRRPKGARWQDSRARRRRRPGARADASRGVPCPSPATFPKTNRYLRGASPKYRPRAVQDAQGGARIARSRTPREPRTSARSDQSLDLLRGQIARQR